MKSFSSDADQAVVTAKSRRLPPVANRLLKLTVGLCIGTILAQLRNYYSTKSQHCSLHPLVVAPPAKEWKDDVWPIRQQTPWDISTDYPYPRKLEYDVTEGTWLRLDVHPKSGDIVFDILGDIYCLPRDAYSDSANPTSTKTKALPVLLGAPHDSDPHFSPNGDKLVFRSDAELGIENIWVTEWKGCAKMDVRSSEPGDELLTALDVKDSEEELLAHGVKESSERKRRRLLREGRISGVFPSLISYVT